MKTIWILGAGASISHSKGKFPAINQFFQIANEMKILSNSNEKINEDYKGIKEYVQNLFGEDILKENIKIDIEELLTNIEIDIDKNSSTRLNNIRHNIIKLIRNLLYKLIEEVRLETSDYNTFIEKHLNKEDTIISFNWDLLLDDVLKREQFLKGDFLNKEENQYYNFYKDLSSHGENTWGRVTPKKPYIEYSGITGYYLKLHGSVDWLYCSNEKCRAYGKVYPSLKYMEKHYCAECNEEMNYLLIPPVLNKKYNKYPFIRTIWNKATKEIQCAEKLIIWGYSLPPTDFYSNWLLRQARENIKELILINPACIKENSWNKEFIQKFYKLYKGKISYKNIKAYCSFKDFINNHCIISESISDEFNYKLI